MSTIFQIDRSNAICALCRSSFDPGEEQLTHLEGNHDGFHRSCLREMFLHENIRCPYQDGHRFNPNPLLTTAERMRRKFKHAVMIGIVETIYILSITTFLKSFWSRGRQSGGVVTGLGAGSVGILIGSAAGAFTGVLILGIAAKAGIIQYEKIRQILLELGEDNSTGAIALITSIVTPIVADIIPSPSIAFALMGGIAQGVLSFIKA